MQNKVAIICYLLFKGIIILKNTVESGPGIFNYSKEILFVGMQNCFMDKI